MHLFVFYAPESHLDSVKNALFECGAGKYKNYDRCCWQTEGEGQFRPLEGSSPFSGKPGEIERVKEFRVEMLCEDKDVDGLISKLKQYHPYEEPAYHALKIII